MSKRRLVITAVLTGRSQSEAARSYGVSQGWISRLMARYAVEGKAAFEPLSRAPQSRTAATPPPTVDLVLRLRKQLSEAGLDAGADTIGWHLRHTYATQLSRTTINRIPGPGRRGHTGPVQAAQELLPPVRSRPAERDLQSDFTTTGSPPAPTWRS
ncbi:MAG: helix-turn-helix domain-containing protein [Actinomycetota bacterium]|nr:helix-turn-helix domain-containing protein [Actinomycetota bacterium]